MRKKTPNGWHNPYHEKPNKKRKLRSIDHYVAKAKTLGCTNPEVLRIFNNLNRSSNAHRRCMNKLNLVHFGNPFDKEEFKDKDGNLYSRYKLRHAHKEMMLRKARKWLESKGVKVA